MAATVALGLVPATSFADHIPPIDSDLAYTRDGCQRKTVELVNWHIAQEWVYVNNTRDPVVLKGTVEESHVAGGDNPFQHETRGEILNPQYYYINKDFDYEVKPDDGYEGVLATGNGDDIGIEQMPGEWAYRDNYYEWRDFYPEEAWPTGGDRAELAGPLVWDCGHYPGEQTEMHPPAWVHVEHSRPVGYEFAAGRPTIAKEHTLYANSNRQLSGIIDEYELTGQDNNRQNEEVRNGHRTFFLAAPPRPSPGAALVWRERRFATRMLSNVGRVRVSAYPAGRPFDPDPRPGIEVTVDMRGTQSLPDRPDLGYAGKWYVGWNRSATGFKMVRTRFLKFTCTNDNDPGPNPGEFHMYFRANSIFKFNYDAGLESCDDGTWWPFWHIPPEEVTLNPTPTMVQIVPDDRQLDIEIAGAENDDPIPGPELEPHNASYPLANATRWVQQADFKAQFSTEVLRTYPPVP